ncbi:Casein kinase II subunit beta' [Raphanus sativus]|nr:Casein kinase II subunit beta' [Raphanus sativus]
MYAGRGTVGPKAEREEISEAYDVNRSEGKETGESNSVLHDSRSSTLSRTHIFQAVDSSEDSEVKGSDEEDLAWTTWFCKLPGNEFLCEVDDYYILDNFNLCGLRHQVPYYDHALDLILDDDSSPHGQMITDEQNELIESAAEMLYGLIHARYILTDKGFLSMLNKYNRSEFGRCPRDSCSGQSCLPIGLSDVPGASTVKMYCPKCEDVYHPPSKFQGSNIDGAYFGTAFPHLFLMYYPNKRPKKMLSESYVPRLFGFKLHKP